MIIISLILMVLSCIIIWKASDGFDTASEYIGRNLSEGVRGATINAIGSSMPELLTTLFFLFVLKDKGGFAGGIGTTAGSAIFNGMIIPALVILIVIFKGLNSSVKVSRKVLLRDGIALILCELVLIFLIGGNTLTWWHGLVLMLLYITYGIYMFTTMKKEEKSESIEIEDDISSQVNKGVLYNLCTLNLEPIFIKRQINSLNAWVLLSVTTIIIGFACFLLVKSCEWLGEALHIPIYFIAVVLASAATSVPDTVLSLKDAQKGNYNDAVSNALGSNIFDVCFALGFPLFLFGVFYGNIEMSPETVKNVSELRILLLLLTLVSFIIYIFDTKMGKWSAFFLLLLYATFTIFILGQVQDAEFAKTIGDFLSQINMFIEKLRFWEN